jgi:predicted ribosomally synthesized peptide with nif11-like leader
VSILLNLSCIYNKRHFNFIYKEDFIMPINENELTKEILAKAMKCETAEDLIALAKAEGIDLTKEEAEAYLAEMDDVELDDTALQQVAGGTSSVADASQVRIQSFHCGALGLN